MKQKEISDRAIYIKANQGMYGLPQSGLLSNQLLEERRSKHSYRQSKLVPGLWKHNWRPVQFALVVDNFGVKYIGEEHAQHLKKTLGQDYTVTTEWDRKRYIGITLDWDYKQGQVHFSMSNYIKKAIKQLNHKRQTVQHQPFPRAKINYGAKKSIRNTTVNCTAP